MGFLYGMIDEIEIYKYQSIIYGFDNAFKKLKNSFNNFVMFKTFCGDEKYNKYQMWRGNAETFL